MRKCYCSPVTECICVETYVIAASTEVLRSVQKTGGLETNESSTTTSWGSIWE